MAICLELRYVVGRAYHVWSIRSPFGRRNGNPIDVPHGQTVRVRRDAVNRTVATCPPM